MHAKAVLQKQALKNINVLNLFCHTDQPVQLQDAVKLDMRRITKSVSYLWKSTEF